MTAPSNSNADNGGIKYLQANGIQLAYDEFGSKDDPAVILIMGLGTQMIAWHEDFCRDLASRGYRVIRFDNRDIGLSQKMSDQKTPGLARLALAQKLGISVKVPYRLYDMALDTVGLLDALQIDAAHFVGCSMGGMICQIVAAKYPSRCLSLTSIMSNSGARNLPGPKGEVIRQMAKRANGDREARIEQAVITWQLLGSPGYQMPPDEIREMILTSIERSYYPPGYARQLAAVMTSSDRVRLLKTIKVPTQVIHGLDDPLVPVSGGVDTAERIAGAKLELIPGMGHDFPRALWPKFIELIVANAADAG
jgi:pimeloyl-ACP methyl ester carboxylesterase